MDSINSNYHAVCNCIPGINTVSATCPVHGQFPHFTLTTGTSVKNETTMDKVIEQLKEVRFSKWNTKTERVRQPLTIEELKKALMHYKPTEIWHSSYSDKVPFIAAGGYNEKGFIMSFHSAADKTPEYKTYEQFHKYMRVQGLDCLYIKVPNDTKTIELSPATPATSWEEVYNKAQEHAATMGSHGIFGEVNFTDSVEATSYYQNLINYLSQHWPSSQPVSPTPMSETWEKVRKNIVQFLESKSYEQEEEMPDYDIGFNDAIEMAISCLYSCNAPSLHQVDRWVEIRTKAEKEALTKVKEEFRLYYAREDYYGEAWQHFHKERIHKYTLEIIDNILK